MEEYQKMAKNFRDVHLSIEDLFKIYDWDVKYKEIGKNFILKFSFYNNGIYIDCMEEDFKDIFLFLKRVSKIKESELKNYLNVYFTIKRNKINLFKSNRLISIKEEGIYVGSQENCINWEDFGTRLSYTNVNILNF